ncbi:hypothetical protein SK128_010705, partial [Halocaridina rubra]
LDESKIVFVAVCADSSCDATAKSIADSSTFILALDAINRSKKSGYTAVVDAVQNAS